jgi:flagellar basal-body rod protein FlgC
MTNFNDEEMSAVTNTVISASRSYQTNVQLAESAKNMLTKTLQLGQS